MLNLLRFDPWQWVYYWVRQSLWRARLPRPGSPTPLLQTKGPDGGAKTCPVPPLKPLHQPLSLLLSFVPVKDPKHRLTLCIPFPFVGKCLNPPLAQFGYILLRWGWPRDKPRAGGGSEQLTGRQSNRIKRDKCRFEEGTRLNLTSCVARQLSHNRISRIARARPLLAGCSCT